MDGSEEITKFIFLARNLGPAWLTSKIYHSKDLGSQKLNKNIVIDLASQMWEFDKFWWQTKY